MGGYTPFMPYTVRQRPGFTLPNQNAQQPTQPAPQAQQPTQQPAQQPAPQPVQQQQQPTPQPTAQPAPAYGTSYSPFGASAAMQRPGQSLSPEESRRILFSGSPKQNYQDNLIFDGNASVHRRTSAMEVPPVSTTYTEQYQQSVQDTSPVRPQKVVGEPISDRLGGRGGNPYELNIPSEPTPTRLAEDTTRSGGYADGGFTSTADRGGRTPYDSALPEYDSGRSGYSPSYDAPAQSRADAPTSSRAERSGFSSIEQPEQPTQQPVQPATDSGRRHEYMDMFSMQNPRIFGQSGNRPDGVPTEEVAADRSSIFEDEPAQPATDGRSARVDDPYALRGYDEEPTAQTRSSRYDVPPVQSDPVENTTAEERVSVAKKEEPSLPHVPTQRGAVAPVETNVQPQEPAPVKPRIRKPYVRVPLHYFNCNDNPPDSDAVEVEDIKTRIIETLEDYNVVGGTIASVTFGPTVTRYNVVLPRGVSPRKVVALEQEIAMGLCREGVNVYPNVEDGAVSIEVPNRNRQTVELGCMFIDDAYTKAKPTSLVFAMGKDIANRKVYGDVCKMTHLLVAGSSGSGKSVFLGCLIISLITKYSPDELRLILIDPKKTEFVLYNGLPHLMVNEIISDCKKAVQTLSWAIGEMERRYSLIQKKSLSGTYVVNIDEYNANLAPGEEKLPKIVIIVDELADLMLNAKKDVEDKIQSLTQKARAAGIHLILATQRPSIDVITGVIKSNLPTRIAFTVATDVDSRVILDQSGAQKLLGKGDMVYTASGINTPVRVQSPFISSTDSQRVVNFIKENNEAFFDDAATNFINNTRSGGGEGGELSYDEVEPVYLEALKLVIQTQTASISMLQRKCSIGFNKAGKIIEWMETMEYISPYEGAKARRVLITREKFIELYGEW
jgi:S-DNA-T family DNA segregation ATPase FtsK/SpoIIIE